MDSRCCWYTTGLAAVRYSCGHTDGSSMCRVFRGPSLGGRGAGRRLPGAGSPITPRFVVVLYVAGSRPLIHSAARSAARGSSVVLLCKPRAITPAPGCRGKLLVGAWVCDRQYLLLIVF